MPRKPLTAAKDRLTLVPPPSRSLDEIIRERTAGLPPERKIDVARRTILEILRTTAMPLTDHWRLYVALELERLWLPKKESAKIERQRVLRSAERAIEVFRRAKKLAREHGLPTRGGPTAIEAIRPALVKGPDGRTFQSPAALAQFLKRERSPKKKKKKKKPQR